MNSFGTLFRVSTFGESHGEAIGCIIDGVPAGLRLDLDLIKNDLKDRQAVQTSLTTPRKEPENFKILSGVLDGISTGTPIGVVIFNENVHSKDYSDLKDVFRPSHADFTYFYKYGIRDHKGGGRTSARESAVRVVAGAIARQILDLIGIEVLSGVFSVGNVECKTQDYHYAKTSEIYSLDKQAEKKQIELIKQTRANKDSIGAVVALSLRGLPIGLGEPLFNKLDGELARHLMGINAVKAVEIGAGVLSSASTGFQLNDEISSKGFCSNNSGGVLGGISNGANVDIKVHFKPTPSIAQIQNTINTEKINTKISIKGRHDPCVGIRGSIVCRAMCACVLLDLAMLNITSKIDNFTRYYNDNKRRSS